MATVRRSLRLRPSSVSLRDFDLKNPGVLPSAEIPIEQSVSQPVYRYPGGFTAGPEGEALARARLASLRHNADTLAGSAESVELLPGRAIEVLGVRDVIVCGHSHCGAVNAILYPGSPGRLPAVDQWLTATGPHEETRAASDFLDGNALTAAVQGFKPRGGHVDRDAAREREIAEQMARHVPGPVRARAHQQRGRVPGLVPHRHHPAAQVRAAAQRGEQVEVVGRQQRRGRGLGHPDDAVAPASGRCSRGHGLQPVVSGR